MPSFSHPPHPATHYFPTSNVNKNLRRRIYLRLLLLSDSPQVDFYSFSCGLSFFSSTPFCPQDDGGQKQRRRLPHSPPTPLAQNASTPPPPPFFPHQAALFFPCRPRLRCNSRSARSRLSFPGGQIDKPREMSRRPMPICPPGSPDSRPTLGVIDSIEAIVILRSRHVGTTLQINSRI